MFRFASFPLRQSFMGLLLVIAAGAAMALPSPKDIDAAVSAGHLSQAETLLREVIQEKPNSAKAHYELGQVLARQARYADAQAALVQAKTLDPSLKFAVSPEKFNDVFHKVSQQAQSLTGPQAAKTLSEPQRASASTAPAAPEPAFPLHYVWIGIAGLVVLALVLRRQKAPTPAYNNPMQAANASPYGAAQAAPAGYGPGHGPGYAAPYAGGPAAGGMGSGIGGAVVGGLAGVAAGYALSKALEGDHSNHAAPANAGNNGGYVPFDTPAQPDLGSFDAGAGSGWDDASDSAGSDDSW